MTKNHRITVKKERFMPKSDEKPVVKKQRGKNGGARPGTGGAMPGAGRPAFEASETERKQVEALSGYGLPLEQIAVLVRKGISVETLTKHFADELISGKAKANSQVGRTLFQKATGGDTTAMIWWSKTQMKWSETQKVEHTGKDGGAIALSSVDLKGLNDTELAQMQALLMKANGSD
jgi:hypothetical protein